MNYMFALFKSAMVSWKYAKNQQQQWIELEETQKLCSVWWFKLESKWIWRKRKRHEKTKENLNKTKYFSNVCLNIVIRLETQQNRRSDNQTELILVPHLKSIFKCIYERCYSKRSEKTFYFKSDCIFSFFVSRDCARYV